MMMKKLFKASKINHWNIIEKVTMVIKAGQAVGIHLRPHDLRRHSANFASRSGVPIEIVSKVILRHSNLSTTQRYLGKITDTEAMKWIENLYN
jgi:integrase/recombinase XerD